jgi:hypothetical protein
LANSQLDLFEEILARLDGAGVLGKFILVGSWCLPVYQEHYGDRDGIPVLRTNDLDLLVSDPTHVRQNTDVAAILCGLGFEPLHDFNTGLAKYEHRSLEVEFLAARSRNMELVLRIPKLNIEAQVLSYMELAEKYAIKANYKGFVVRVPEIAAFVLHKAIVQTLRSTEVKQEKDAATVRSLGEVVVSRDDMRKRIIDIFAEFTPKWKRIVLGMVEVHSPVLYSLLREI